MLKQFERTSLVIGEDNVKKLNKSKVVVFGAGGVGSYVIEALARAGVGHLVIVDGINNPIIIVIINNVIISKIPEKLAFAINSINLQAITSPTFVHSTIPINCEIKNINTKA